MAKQVRGKLRFIVTCMPPAVSEEIAAHIFAKVLTRISLQPKVGLLQEMPPVLPLLCRIVLLQGAKAKQQACGVVVMRAPGFIVERFREIDRSRRRDPWLRLIEHFCNIRIGRLARDPAGDLNKRWCCSLSLSSDGFGKC